jgi:hypothetical protein
MRGSPGRWRCPSPGEVRSIRQEASGSTRPAEESERQTRRTQKPFRDERLHAADEGAHSHSFTGYCPVHISFTLVLKVPRALLVHTVMMNGYYAVGTQKRRHHAETQVGSIMFRSSLIAATCYSLYYICLVSTVNSTTLLRYTFVKPSSSYYFGLF